MGNWNASAGAIDYDVDWVALTELGSNVDLLPGVTPPRDTPDVLFGAITDTLEAEEAGPITISSAGGSADSEIALALNFTVPYACEIQVVVDFLVEDVTLNTPATDFIYALMRYTINGGSVVDLIGNRTVPIVLEPVPVSLVTSAFAAAAGDVIEVRFFVTADTPSTTGTAEATFSAIRMVALEKRA
jgi:hypothetical protein